ncbi:hypothetical protein EV193_105102 [Herbihabitans rhizosphaerae]|uniref:SnoaL-like protein n=1 Tax=Herbihabitans rhizosphaerae TaxID=1872711 RepID=A0A4Q7KMK9_9PSEU|nr:nuclear transport factor 2 family protein [Herbihabitans rhizosphaerae]RZS37546.1 hypothetical protein EV193_105102 [Herbihabitans rhizosphaerae]
MTQLPTDGAGFTPSEQDVASVLAWFADYDALAGKVDVEGMADKALFPINTVSTGPDGTGAAESWDRATFVQKMTEIMGGAGDVEMDSTRTPHFLSQNLVFVITDATFTVEGHKQTVRYGDLLVRSGGEWKFQTMVQGGWG